MSRGTEAPRRAGSGFVPEDLDAASWSSLEPLYTTLRDREVAGAESFDRWLIDRSDLDAAASEGAATLYIAMTCRTDDEGANAAWSRWLDEVQPELKPMGFALDRKQASLAESFAAGSARYEVLNRDTANEIELYREENVPLLTRLSKLDQRYDQLCGAMTVEFEGEERTLPQMARYLEETDRGVRESAWRGVSARRLSDRDAIDGIFDEMVSLRARVGANAGFSSYRDYAHRAKGRFDYTPEDCESFQGAIEAHAVPFMRRLDDRRRASLGVESLRPWDLGVDEKGRRALRPFEGGQELVERTRSVFRRLDGGLGGLFESLGDNMAADGCFDLDSRRGKASGGYQYMRDRRREPFIFMNAAGVHRDVETMVHEAGHAFHSMLCVDEPLVAYRHAPIEFAEVASMTMELLTMPMWDEYYASAADADRARRKQLEGSISLLPWIATVDAFQHWVYRNPGHTREERTAAWLGLDDRFGHALDWSGLDDARATQWQRQGHLFGAPFYYVEYGIAQLGALGVWLNAKEHGVERALADYKRALSLGGSRPLPELFEAAGVPFDFGEATVARLVSAVEDELSSLPE